MLKNKLTTPLLLAATAIVAMAGGTALMASAQTTTAPSTPVAVTTTSTTSGTDNTADKPHGHAPLGGDGVVASITGSTIVMAEESDEGGASYTVDASKATVTNHGAAATLSDIKAGDKVFVQGTVSGTAVSATSVSLGRPHESSKEGINDADGGAASEGSEGTSTSGGADQ